MTARPDDPHSAARPEQVRVTHLALDLELDFESKTALGTARLQFERHAGDILRLDSKGLDILEIKGGDNSQRSLTRRDDPVLGTPIDVLLQPSDSSVTIRYRTTKDSDALQWLTPEQTAGGRMPFLYTQGQAILTRSWIPLQDSPSVRLTYEATIKAPAGMRVVMSAEHSEQLADGRYRFAMPKPIPPYLIALACGDLGRRDLSERCAVYADPTILEAAAAELSDTDAMLRACEKVFGPYRWGRYDVLILPPAFPFGGMENPTMTFATPTILAGDKSLVALIAHELAHSWSGNLVTNATWRDFWLNEGFTVFLEHRIMEIVYGKERADMEIQNGLRDLERELADLAPGDQVLHIDLAGRNPDDGMTAVAYDKGAAFLRRLEQVFGRERFDAFLQGYFSRHAFTSITTERFLADLQEHLLRHDAARAAQVDIQTWVHKSGLPADTPRPHCPAFAAVAKFAEAWLAGEAPAADARHFVTHQWLHFLASLRRNLTAEQMRRLDADFAFSQSRNSEILASWLVVCVRRNHRPVWPVLERFLLEVGRRKFLKPIYEALVQTEAGQTEALRIYRQARPKYHAVSRRTLDALVGWKD